MEKDSFEKLLRSKVLQAESTLNQGADKEKVWNAIQKNRAFKHKFYYAATAIFFLMVLVSVLYVKEDKTIDAVAKTKQSRKPLVMEVPKPQILQQAIVPIKIVRREQIVATVKQMENAEQMPESNASKEALPIVVQQKSVEPAATIATANMENKTIPIATLSLVPEFTVQFKRGRPADEVEVQTKAAIARLKKFKLSKDTSILANTVEKQKSLFKIKF